MSREVARELRRLTFYTGGHAIFILADKRTKMIPSRAACAAIERAAERLGYGRYWRGVTNALKQWALSDVLSEAIEEQEAMR